MLSIEAFLGKGSSFLSISSSLTLAAISFFYIYSLASHLKPTVWILVSRVSYYSPFEAYIFSSYVDHAIVISGTVLWMTLSIRPNLRFFFTIVYGGIALISALLSPGILESLTILTLPIIISLIFIDGVISNKFLISDKKLVINYLSVIGIGTGIIAIILSLGPFYLPGDTRIQIPNFAYEIYVIFSSISPAILVLLILSYPVKIISDQLIVKVRTLKKWIRNDVILSKDTIRTLTKIILLLLFIALSVILAVIPHEKAINVDKKDVGVDTHYYVKWIGTLLKSASIEEVLNQSFVVIQHGDRPFSLLFFLMIADILPSSNYSYIFDNIPIILGPILVLVVYFLTRELTSSDTASIFSAFLTATSFHILVGIYAGSYANWLALIVGYLSMIFLLRSLKRTTTINIAIFFILMITLLLTHIYTWSILSMVMGVFLLILLKLRYYERRSVILLLLVLFLSVLLDVVRMIITGAYSGIGYEISPPFGSDLRLAPDQFATRWSSLIDTTQNYYGSLYGNFIIYGLGLYWLISSKLKEVSTIFLIAFLSIGIIPLFLGNWSVQTRVFYDIPFQIPAGIALTYVYRKSNGIFIVMPVMIWLIAISITDVSNFYFVPPS